jgi:hypothetical protein
MPCGPTVTAKCPAVISGNSGLDRITAATSASVSGTPCSSHGPGIGSSMSALPQSTLPPGPVAAGRPGALCSSVAGEALKPQAESAAPSHVNASRGDQV